MRAGLLPWVIGIAVLSGCNDRPAEIPIKDRAEGHYVYGTSLFLGGELEKAHEQYRLMEALTPEDPRLPAAFGEVLLAQQKLSDALASFDKAARLDPRRSTNWSRIGFIHSVQGRDEEAASALRKAVALNPEDSQALETLGEIELRAGRLDAAVKSWSLAADAAVHREQGAVLFVRAAEELVKADRRPDAVKLLKSAAGRGASSTVLLVALGELLVQERAFEEALHVLTEAASKSPYDPGLWEMVGELHVALDRPGDALTAYRESLKVRDRAVVRVALARIHRARKDELAAKEELERALEVADGTDERETREVAAALVEFGRKREGLSLYEVLASEPENEKDTELQLRTAKLARELGSTEVVTSACSRVRLADPSLKRCP